MAKNADDARPDSRHLSDQLEGTSNVLVRSSCFGGSKTTACTTLLGNDHPQDTSTLVITCSEPADRWLERHRTHAKTLPRNLVVIGVGGNSGATTTTWTEGNVARHLTPGEPHIDAIGDPADFTGLGIKITEYLRTFEEARYDDGPNTITCCFDSLTALTQYADLERVYRFLHALTDWIRKSSATAHYHLDPQAHDERETTLLEPLFDATLHATDGTESADWTIERTQ